MDNKSLYWLSDFDFELPSELIAQTPAPERSASRLLVIDRLVDREAIADRMIRDLPSLLDPRDLLVFNDTRVIRARLHGRKDSGGLVEILIERLLGANEALAQIRASHAPKPGSSISVGEYRLQVVDRDDRFFRLRLDADDTQRAPSIDALLDTYGEVPLPPYITRPSDNVDAARYQTIYAAQPGAVAAPTAGLHFDDALFAALKTKGVATAFITLHVGAGTFLPVQTEDLSQHRMHSEWFDLPVTTVDAIARTIERGGRIVAVGTTTLRALESAAADGELRAGPQDTSLFITPGFRFRVVDRLLTNFHLPKSTLLMLVSAFAGFESIRAAYRHAIEERYRFFSYGDAMLLTRRG